MKLIDVNVNIGQWPARSLPLDQPAALVARLRRADIQQAWTGSFDALLHRDMDGVNRRLAETCRQHGDGVLVPFGSVHPLLPDWAEDVRRCAEDYRMPGVRLYPGYHGYTLADPIAAEVLETIDRYKMIVQVVLRMEDVRTQPLLLRAADVDWQPLVPLAERLPNLRIVVLNGLTILGPVAAAQLARAGRVYFETAMLEGAGGIERLLENLSPDRLLFGSHAPFFVLESALLKLRESDLDAPTQRLITSGNAQRLLDDQR